MVKLSLQKFKKDKNKRVHFTDIRPFCGMHRDTQTGIEMLLENMKARDRNFNYVECFEQIYFSYIEYVIIFLQDIKKYETDKDAPFRCHHYVLSKEISKLEKIIGKPTLLKLLKSAETSIRFYFNKIYNKDNYMSLQQFRESGFELVWPITFINELYVLARILKPEFKNIVVYEGNAHYGIIMDYLRFSLNFNIMFENFDGMRKHKNSFQCVKALPFDIFFKHGIVKRPRKTTKRTKKTTKKTKKTTKKTKKTTKKTKKTTKKSSLLNP